MDTLYIGDIPKQYHYALFGNGYIDLYNTNVLHNNNYTYYRVFTNVNGFYYEKRDTSVSSFTTTYTNDINVSNNKVYRQDFDSIVFITFVFVLFGIWLLNIISSIIRKGGVLGGLL